MRFQPLLKLNSGEIAPYPRKIEENRRILAAFGENAPKIKFVKTLRADAISNNLSDGSDSEESVG